MVIASREIGVLYFAVLLRRHLGIFIHIKIFLHAICLRTICSSQFNILALETTTIFRFLYHEAWIMNSEKRITLVQCY